MRNLSEKFPEINSSLNSMDIPWKDAVVWIEKENGREKYNWVLAKEIMYVSWTNGIVSIIPSESSILSNYFQAILINSDEVFIGKNVKVSN